MATPLRFDMILPNGEPLRWDTPGARWGGTVEEVMAAIAEKNKAMSNQNKVSAQLVAQTVTEILAAFATIKTKLPFLISLTDDERAHLPHSTLHALTKSSGGAKSVKTGTTSSSRAHLHHWRNNPPSGIPGGIRPLSAPRPRRAPASRRRRLFRRSASARRNRIRGYPMRWSGGRPS